MEENKLNEFENIDEAANAAEETIEEEIKEVTGTDDDEIEVPEEVADVINEEATYVPDPDKSVTFKMTFGDLYNFLLNNYYRGFAGFVGLMISILAIAGMVTYWGKMMLYQYVIFGFLALSFPVINPVMLAWKAFKQLNLTPSYKKPLTYEVRSRGITVSQGEIHQTTKWSYIRRIMMTGKVLVLYTNRLNAFVIPKAALGENESRFLTMIVQFTDNYKPRLSKSLKVYRSGKGLK